MVSHLPGSVRGASVEMSLCTTPRALQSAKGHAQAGVSSPSGVASLSGAFP